MITMAAGPTDTATVISGEVAVSRRRGKSKAPNFTYEGAVIPEGAGFCQEVVDQGFWWFSASVWAAPGKGRGQDGAPAA